MRTALEEARVTMCQGVPAMYAKYLEHLAASGRAFHAPALRAIYCGGSPLAASVKRTVEAGFGLTLHNGYGLTEAAPTIAQTRHDAPRTDCSVGPALPGVELRIVASDGQEVSDGGVGELWVRGPNVMQGYYRDAVASAEALRPGGWLATGDLARLDPDGALHIEGRLKELIIRSGFNVFPVEVESVLNAHPEVSQSAVVGRDVEGNEEVVAFVELVPGARVDARALVEFAAARLAPYKRPAEVIVMEKLPAAASGKLLKGRLKELARASAPPAPAG
jgi:acyl-CoA synthetase (AMP-forming)/AMP-acid ligase II